MIRNCLNKKFEKAFQDVQSTLKDSPGGSVGIPKKGKDRGQLPAPTAAPSHAFPLRRS